MDSRQAQASAAAPDGLGHDALAEAIVSHVAGLPAGSVIAVQGPWGRGKTDVLSRVLGHFERRASNADAPEPLWLNPWQYGSPNLIAPLVVQLLERMTPASRQGNERLRRAAQTLLRAGNAIAFKAVSVLVPFGEVLQAGKEPVDDLIRELFDPAEDLPPIDVDPVQAMAARFRELVEEYLATGGDDEPLVICVDDLDRCLPDHQIAMLEAIHFLVSADARAYFIVAIDPTLVQQAAVTHYAGAAFDTNQYLDKLFDLRVNLRALRATELEAAIELRLAREVLVSGEPTTADALVSNALGVKPKELRAVCARIFYLPEVTNPRFVGRVLDRLVLFASAADAGEHFSPGPESADLTRMQVAEALIRFLTIADRWPKVRTLLQSSIPEYWHMNLNGFVVNYGVTPPDVSEYEMNEFREGIEERPELFGRLPTAAQSPDLARFLRDTLLIPETGAVLVDIDRRLVEVGL